MPKTRGAARGRRGSPAGAAAKAPADRRRAAPADAAAATQTKTASPKTPRRTSAPIAAPHPQRRRRARGAAETHPHFGLRHDALVELWYQMLLARKVAERWFVLNRQGRAPFAITGQGHEAVQVGTAAALTPGKDWVVPYYRDIGVVLTLGMSVEELMLDVFAKATNPNSGGRQMPAHFSSKELRIVSGSSPVATQVPIAAGLAFAAKLRGEDSVAAVYLGEGSTNQGDFHEGLNFAAVMQAPLVVIVENNGYAITEVQRKEMVIRDVADRAAAYGIPGVVIDGNDVLEVYRTMQWAVHEARLGNGPSLIEAKTYRTVPHSSDDDDRRYRPREELNEWLKRDPIDRFRQHLKADGILGDEHAEQLIQEADADVRSAEERAETAPDPDPATLREHLFAAPVGGGP